MSNPEIFRLTPVAFSGLDFKVLGSLKSFLSFKIGYNNSSIVFSICVVYGLSYTLANTLCALHCSVTQL